MFGKFAGLMGLGMTLSVLVGCAGARDVQKSTQGEPSSGVASNQSPVTTVAGTRTPAPTATASPKRQVSITASGYGVSSTGGSVGYAFTIRNENEAEAAESVSVQVSFQDASGTVLGTSQDSIAVLGPGEHIGSAGSAFFKGQPGMKMVVQALPSKWTAVGPIPPFTFTNTAYIDDRFFSKVTGIIKSPFTKDYKYVRVSAIGLDGAGNIVGGGFTFVDFVPASGTTAVSVSYTGAKPATTVLYGQVSSLSLLGN